MLTGFIEAYKALGNEKYLEIAIKNANFINDNLWSNNGNLFHNFKNNKATINGYLEDYCFVIEAFINLYEVTFNGSWLTKAKQLTDYCFDYFFDTTTDFFRFTSRLDKELIATHFEIEDNVISASNSVMAQNLFKLSIYFENAYYETVCKKMLHHIIPNIDYPSAYANWMNVFMNFDTANKELVIMGNAAVANAKIGRASCRERVLMPV